MLAKGIQQTWKACTSHCDPIAPTCGVHRAHFYIFFYFKRTSLLPWPQLGELVVIRACSRLIWKMSGLDGHEDINLLDNSTVDGLLDPAVVVCEISHISKISSS